MTEMKVNPIGVIRNSEEGCCIKIQEKFVPALLALEGFSHIQVIWWFSGFDDELSRSLLQVQKPYKHGPDTMGIFATRSPLRPNPIALTTSEVIDIDHENGIIRIAYTDADDHTPVLDIKPYTPSLDRPDRPSVPVWCRHWPDSIESSAFFNWKEEFNFE